MEVGELLNPLLARFLDETRLRSAPQVVPQSDESPPPQVQPVWASISEVLGIGYGERAGAVITKGRALMRARTTPSAGALYPFDVLVAFRGAGEYLLYRYEVAGCCLNAVGRIDAGELAALLAESEDGARPEDAASLPGSAPSPDAAQPADPARLPAAVIAVVGRPWKSMRKYGRRGYLYTQLDGAHAATNIALAAEDFGYRPVVRLRFDRGRAVKLLGLEELCREPQVLIALADPAGPGTGTEDPPAAVNPFALPIWRHDSEAPLEEPDAAERESWRTISPVSSDRHGRSSAPRPPGPMRSVLGGSAADGADDTGDGTSPLALPGAGEHATPEFRTVALTRNSAKGFRPLPLDTAPFGRALAGLGAALTLDCVDGPAVGLRVLVRDIGGIRPGSYAYVPGSHALRPVGEDPGSDEAVMAACMNQGVVKGAAALLAFHAPVRSIVAERGWQGLVEVHFHAAAAAQRICLGARASGVGATCMGGFDSDRVADLVGLDPADEVVYTLAAGIPDETAVKWDRAPIAYSHGFAS